MTGTRRGVAGLAVVAAVMIVSLCGVVVARAVVVAPRVREHAPPPATITAVDTAGAAERLAQAVRFKTTAVEGNRSPGAAAFTGLHRFLRQSYRHAHRALSREVVGTNSLLYYWGGTDPRLKPILLMAHLDVVPIERGTESAWVEPPFAGRISDGHIWGRGTIDDKSAVLAILEAVDLLVDAGFRPRRTVYLAFGHDEETRGREGAARIAELLKSRGVTFEYVLDEGLFIVDGIVPGMARPVAVIGTAEKGWLTLELRAEGPGGHASIPPPHTAVGALAAAIQRLETNPMPAAINPPVNEFFLRISPETSWMQRLVFTNLWLFGPAVKYKLGQSPTTNALIRTTSAVTITRAGTVDNVLPRFATAVVNFRVLPGDTTTTVMDYAQRVVADPTISIEPLKREEPSVVSATDSPGFKTITQTINQLYPEAVVAPGLLPARTDSAHFAEITEAIFRFRPLRMTPGDVDRIHGTNERISVDGYAEMIRFYVQLLRNANSGE